MRGLRLRGDRGAVLAEFALVVPSLLFLLMGAVDFTYTEMQYDSVSSAARDGARVGILQVIRRPVTTLGAQSSCVPTPVDAEFTAICHAVAHRLAGVKVDSVQVICYAGVGPDAPLPAGVTNPNTGQTCTGALEADASMVQVVVRWTDSPLTFVGASTIGTRHVVTKAEMVIAG